MRTVILSLLNRSSMAVHETCDSIAAFIGFGDLNQTTVIIGTFADGKAIA